MTRIMKLGIVAVVLAALGVAAIVGISLLRSDDANLATEAPAIPTAAAAGATASTTVSAAASTPASGAAAQSANVHRFVIDPAQSSAKYVVQETLRGLDTTAVGQTSTIEGSIFLTPQGLATGQKSTFKVDLRTLKSDENLRDNFIRMNTLQANQFPFAEFTIDSVTGFPTSYTPGQEVSLTLTGSMTIKGVTKPMTFQVKARQADDFLTATADAAFKMTDFGITPPDVQLAKARDEVKLQVVFVAKRTAG
jgi:polyisoprenoid-binding protein YceI